MSHSFQGLIQRLENILTAQFDTRQRGEVDDFDFIGIYLPHQDLNQARNCGTPSQDCKSAPMALSITPWDSVEAQYSK